MNETSPRQLRLPRGARPALWVLALAALPAFCLGLAFDPKRAWADFLLAYCLVLGLALGGAVFVAIHDITASRWATSFRRLPESMASALPWMLVPSLVLALGAGHFYAWALPAEAARLYPSKRIWLGQPFFGLRTLGYVALWAWASGRMLRGGRQGLEGRGRRAALFLVLFGSTFWLAAMDWLMSLQPAWYSDIFGIYVFAGIFQSGLAAILLLLLAGGGLGWPGTRLLPQQLHDLGKLLFVFCVFWAYIWFFQYMLIWYADLPGQASYFVLRSRGAWFLFFLGTFFLNFALPFLMILSQPAKHDRRVLALAAALIVLGHWLDLFVMILPDFSAAGPRVGWMGVLIPLGALSAFLLLFLSDFRRATPVAEAETLAAARIAYEH